MRQPWCANGHEVLNPNCVECLGDLQTAYNEAYRNLEDAAMLLRMSVRKLKKGGDSARCFADKITDWLNRKGLQGSILRAGQAERGQ